MQRLGSQKGVPRRLGTGVARNDVHEDVSIDTSCQNPRHQGPSLSLPLACSLHLYDKHVRFFVSCRMFHHQHLHTIIYGCDRVVTFALMQ